MSSLVGVSVRPPAPSPLERGGRTARLASSAISSRVYVPALGVACAAAVLIGIGWASDWGGKSLAGSESAVRVVLIGPLTLALLGVFLVVERLRPAQRRPLIAPGNRQDVLYTILNATLCVPLGVALSLAFGAIARDTAPWIVLPRMSALPRWGALVLVFVGIDACNYAVHFMIHRLRVLWRFHEVHHSQEDLSVLTVFRTHPLIHVPYLLALIPTIVLAANGVLSTTLLAVYAAIVAFAHSNTNMGFGPLERIFVSPNYHRVHHLVDGPQDVNMGFALTIWDQLFGSAVFPTEATIRGDTGLAGRPLAVEQEAPRRHLATFAAQLLGPFRPMHVATDLPPVRSREGETIGRTVPARQQRPDREVA